MKFILKNDDGESESDGDYDLDGEADDEIDEVGKAIWDHHHTFYRVFDAYASLGTGNDFLHMSPNGFNQFINDCGIAIKNHKFCSKNHIDQLFELINLTETKTSPSERKAMQKVRPAHRTGRASRESRDAHRRASGERAERRETRASQGGSPHEI